VEPHKGTPVPEINSNEVMVYQGHDRNKVLEWIPAQGDHAALQLFFLIDDALDQTVGTQLEDIRQFINHQPPTTLIGIAYMQNGIARVEQDLTNDHQQVVKALRLPQGNPGVNASPYFSLSDLIKRWPATWARRAVFMVTDGVDRFYGTGDLQDLILKLPSMRRCARESWSQPSITPALGILGTATGRVIGGRFIFQRLRMKLEGKRTTSGSQAHQLRSRRTLTNWAIDCRTSIC
jgi:hypothetical protein